MSRARERIRKAICERGFDQHFIEYVRGSNMEMVGDTSGWVVSVEGCPEVFVGRTVDDVIKDICGGLPTKEADQRWR